MKSLEERFWEKVDKNGPIMPHMMTPCWVWTGAESGGYGQLGLGGRNGGLVKATQVSWKIHHVFFSKMCILHHCDNPPCVRPDHLYEGTQKDNARDREVRGRMPHYSGDEHWARKKPELLPRGQDHGNAKLTQEQVISIRSEYTGKYGQQKALAIKYGVDVQTIRRVTQGKTYAEE